MKFRPFPSPVVLLLALLHVYVGVRLLLPFGAVTQLVGWALLAVCLWLFPKGFWIREDRTPSVRRTRQPDSVQTSSELREDEWTVRARML